MSSISRRKKKRFLPLRARKVEAVRIRRKRERRMPKASKNEETFSIS